MRFPRIPLGLATSLNHRECFMAGKKARVVASKSGSKRAKGITQKEVRDVEELSTPRTPVIYEIVRKHGDEEMERPAFSLWWSGLAAGLAISFSVLAQAILQQHLPDAGWRPLIASIGYSFGFLIVILGRQQLFTESTITAVLPVISDPRPAKIASMLRMWGIVLAANLTGTLFAALFCTLTPVTDPAYLEQMLSLGRHLVELSWAQKFVRGISAGFLIAALVWIRPAAEGSQVALIFVMTYLIAVTGSTHIVAGSMETFLLVVNGELSPLAMAGQFFIPVLAGNIVGGTALFGLLAYGQVVKEM
jgi:formate/nitrite transporter FocA (FNT family)